MATSDTLQIPKEGMNLMAFAAANPNAIPDAMKAVKQLRNIELRPVPAGTQNQGRIPAVVSDKNIVLPLPIIMNRSVGQVDVYAGGTAGANYSQVDMQAVMTNLSNLNAKMNQLLQEMTNAHLNPR